MSNFFNRSDPKQAVPGDLAGGRDAIIRALFGNGGQAPGQGGGPIGWMSGQATGQGPQQYRNNLGGTGQGQNSVLNNLLGLTSDQTPGGDVLGPLRASSDQRLNDLITEQNANSPARFSTANAYQNSQLIQRSQQDFNLLGAQVLERGRDRQLQAIMGLLGPVLGPTFGGPFTQNASGFENFLGLINAGAGAYAATRGGGNNK